MENIDSVKILFYYWSLSYTFCNFKKLLFAANKQQGTYYPFTAENVWKLSLNKYSFTSLTILENTNLASEFLGIHNAAAWLQLNFNYVKFWCEILNVEILNMFTFLKCLFFLVITNCLNYLKIKLQCLQCLYDNSFMHIYTYICSEKSSVSFFTISFSCLAITNFQINLRQSMTSLSTTVHLPASLIRNSHLV